MMLLLIFIMSLDVCLVILLIIMDLLDVINSVLRLYLRRISNLDFLLFVIVFLLLFYKSY